MAVRYYKVETSREELADDFGRQLELDIENQRILEDRKGPPLNIWSIDRQDFSRKPWHRVGQKFDHAHLSVILEIPDQDVKALRGFFGERLIRVLEEKVMLRARYTFAIASGSENEIDYWEKLLRRQPSDIGVEGLSVELKRKTHESGSGAFFHREHSLRCEAEGNPVAVDRFRKFVERENATRGGLLKGSQALIYDYKDVDAEATA